MFTTTLTTTYTVTDVRRVLASLAADLHMIAQATGLWSRGDVTGTIEDLIGFAAAGYLVAVDIILWSEDGNKLRAAKFAVSTTAAGWTSDRPGNNLWPQTSNGSLQVVATLNPAWWSMTDSEKQRARERNGIKGTWAPTNVDTSHRDLSAVADRRYASHGYGVQRTLYS